MDMEKLTHRSFRTNVLVALVLSGVIVTCAALLGRGLSRIQGALVTETPTELTVARLLEPYELFPMEIYELPKRSDNEYRYSITMKGGDVYFVRVSPEGPPWTLVAKPELLRSSR